MSHSIFDSLSGLKSLALMNCAGLVLYPTVGLPDLDHPIELSLVFDRISLLICGASDGESIEITQGKFENSSQIDMGEIGRIQIYDLSKAEPYRKCVGGILEKSYLIQHRVSSNVSGLKFDFGNDLLICIVNLGDDFWIFDHIPNHVRRDYVFIELLR